MIDEIAVLYAELAAEAAALDRRDHLLPPEDGGDEALQECELPFFLAKPPLVFEWPPRYLHPKCVYRDHAHAVIEIKRKDDPYRNPVRILFGVRATGDYLLDEAVVELDQWSVRPQYLPVKQLEPWLSDGRRGHHEWYAARKHAIKAIATYRLRHGGQGELDPNSPYHGFTHKKRRPRR